MIEKKIKKIIQVITNNTTFTNSFSLINDQCNNDFDYENYSVLQRQWSRRLTQVHLFCTQNTNVKAITQLQKPMSTMKHKELLTVGK